MKIGIIGAENSHSIEISKNININKCVKGFTVDYIWGETDEFARKTAQEGNIPNIVKKPQDMLGKIDALVVDHRHAKHHLKAAAAFVKAGVPAYIDKPFCYRVSEGEKFLQMAKDCGTPVTSFGVLPKQKSFERFVKKIKNPDDVVCGSVYGPCDMKSPFGGIFFYGIHTVEMALNAFGFDVSKVLLTQNKQNATGQLMYDNGRIVTLNLHRDYFNFSIAAQTTGGFISSDITFDTEKSITGIKVFTDMFKTKVEPISHEDILMPIRVLEALQKSQKSKAIEKV
jgi:hypothetical protein